MKDNDLIFDVVREPCTACFSSEPQFEVDMEDVDFITLKKIFNYYDFNTYESEGEEVSKTIRCIINFIDEEPNLISI